ncbi:unnamed protein product [Litomosoides sigmodontis]|uniref:RBR-type E3 ubiquitin transferase n=1 Tax=Litomosoides sigmodontis TaxID=42156 RepID=A0A3P6S3E1_LITSI|nr:unnamed protein product [Litomosoides sigmodontis]
MVGEELINIFKSQRGKIRLENTEIVYNLPRTARDTANHSISRREQSYFILERESGSTDKSTKQIMEQQIREWCSSIACTNAVPKVAEDSIIPVHRMPKVDAVDVQSQSSSNKAYGEPPTFTINDLYSTQYLESVIKNSTFGMDITSSRRNATLLRGVNYCSRKMIPCPPWQQALRRVRGKFICDTGKLKKRKEHEASSISDCDFLEAEILKRSLRLKIFDEIHAKCVQMLKKSPTAETLIAEIMEHEIERFAQGLPIYDIRKNIKDVLCNQARVLLIVADTGSGKSTQIPQYLAFDDIITTTQKVLCTQPRKTAVYDLATRVAKETSLSNQCLVNISVYKNGMRPIPNAKINFITEQHLLDCILQDDKLSPFGCVVIDEVHERTLNTDMCLGMMKRVLRLRSDMKLVICSATVDPEPILEYFAEFKAQKLEVQGRQYPIKICYEPPVTGCGGIRSLIWDYIDRTVKKVAHICSNEAKKQPFEEISLDDTLETHAAHIMAFLSNPLETLIAEERLSKQLAELNHSVKVKIMTLYGDMPVEDQVEVFGPLESGYHHKVIFATNVGETSITIPGVRYIVDCGLAKVKKFDVTRRRNVLELGLISKSAAKQRAGRAGRTAPGICYRLYSEQQYEAMESTNTPEILVSSLTEVVLYMISAGITDPSQFDFIGKLDPDILISLKAIECHETGVVLTNLGKQMKQLPIEPRLAKMVLDSLEYNLVAETAVVCACIHVGSLFHRGNKKEKFILADQKKLSFCEDSGDPMTSLAVFLQHIKTPKKRSNYWCFENYVNSKRMKCVHNTAYKICKIIYHLTGVNANINNIDISKARTVIPNLFCRAFGSNLAIYSGLPELGYYDFNEKKYVFIHPSSALKYTDITPEVIVYECSVRTSNDFVFNVCAADPSWLNEINQNVLEEGRKNKLVPYEIRCGATTKKWIMTHKDILQQEVGMECIWKKRFDDPYNRLQIYVSVRNLPKLEAFVERISKEKVNALYKTKEVPIMHADYMLHISGSGTPLEILMPGEFCSMYVGPDVINWTDNVDYRKRLEEYFSKFGQITEFVTFRQEYQRKTGHSCLIRMENKEVAKRAFIYNSENHCGFNIEPRLVLKYPSKGDSSHSSAYRLLIKWWRRPSFGYGQIKLKSRDFNQRLYAFNVVSKHLGYFQPSLLSEDLMIKLLSLPLDIDDQQLHRILKPILDAHGIEFDEAFVIRKKKYPPEDNKALEKLSERITNYIIRVTRNSEGSSGCPFEVKIRAPKHSGEIEFVAFVLFHDMNAGMRISNMLKAAAESGAMLEMGPAHHMHPVGFAYFSTSMNEVKAAIDKVIDGYTIKCKNGERVDGVELPCHRLLTRVGQNFLRALPRKYAVFISTSPYKMEVKVQGSISTIEKIKIEIKHFLREWLDADVSQILILQTPNYKPGTLKAFLAQNNYDLCSLEKKFGPGVHLDANITRRELLFVGKEAQFHELLKMLHSISESIELRDASETIFSEIGIPECVVCLCPADLENYCLEACGHYACKSCLNMQLKASFEMRDFPIFCAACEKPFTWLDMENLVLGDFDRNKNDDPQKLQSLSDASLACFIERHGGLYRHCLTPDCRGLHYVTTDAGLAKCGLCGRMQCTKCGKEEHESITCEEYEVLRVNVDESVRKWIREDQAGRRICPNANCQSVIEKFGGCNHMQCSRCKKHFCWICMFSADESSDIYAHMDATHGGSGAEFHELMGEIENDPFIREFIERENPMLLLDQRFNFDEETEFWVMPDEDADGGSQVLMTDNDDDEVHNFFDFHQELNELLINEIDEPTDGFEVNSGFEMNEDADAYIM